MKTWISFLLPDDEYKEKKMLHFLAEGGFLLFLFLIGMTILNQFYNIGSTTTLLLSILFFIVYVGARYILSGIEYTDVVNEKAYKRELKLLITKTTSFVIIFTLLYVVFVEFPSTWGGWFELLGMLFTVTLLWFMTSFISLKRSYKKNKDLMS